MVFGEDRAKRLQSRNPGDDTFMACRLSDAEGPVN